MDSPIPLLLTIAFYLYFVISLGPRLMKKREPFILTGVMMVYNLAQIFFNGIFVVESLRLLWLPGKFNFMCQTVDYSNDPLALKTAAYVWLFFITRLLDLLDTVFMVLRKKHNQVSFLHIYHHTGMALGSWIGVKYLPGGHPLFLGVVNAFVHAIMYSYYLLTSVYPTYKESIWWKKHITELQLMQFLVTALHMLIGLLNFNCDYPKIIMAIIIPQDIFMFMLFWDFYKKTYYKSKT
ncbi:hypothetical protein AAG570_003960 [Ranatra chinensis]|uniref:Elongation of very long chain fatty acids protein n=1 Tax=Ranatra chinensis TaxID=642074 RepID=A0ABD0Y3R3_9HEMI